jgi:hypothetical protein
MAAAIAAGFLPALASAETPPPVAVTEAQAPELTVVASFFSRYELRDNYAGIGVAGGRLLESDGVAYRARLGLGTKPVDIGGGQTVAVALVPQASGFWADSGSTLSDDGLDVHEAYVRLAGPSFRADVGRFEMAYGDHLVIGDVGWHETGRSFDGARLRIEPGASGAWIDGFVTQLGEGRGSATGSSSASTAAPVRRSPAASSSTCTPSASSGRPAPTPRARKSKRSS